MSDAAAQFQGMAAQCDRASTFDFDGFRVRVHTNVEPLEEKLEQYFAVFRAEGARVDAEVFAFDGDVPGLPDEFEVKVPEPGKKNVKEHILRLDDGVVVRKIRTGVHLGYFGDHRIAAGPLVRNANQVVNFVNNVYMDWLLAERGQLFHAAGVCQGNIGLGLAGPSGKGKSTLALRLLESGLDFVSNDRLVVRETDRGLSMRGVPKYPRINPGTIINQKALVPLASATDLARYRALSEDELWDLEEKYDAFVDECFDGCQFRLAARLAMFVLIDWDRKLDEPARLERAEPGAVRHLLPAVMKTPGVMLPVASRRVPVAREEDYLALLSQAPLFVLRGGVDFDLAAEYIRAEITKFTAKL